MTRTLMLLTVLSLTGCVFYQDADKFVDDTDDLGSPPGWDDDSDWLGPPDDSDTALVDTADTEVEEPPPIVPLTFDPAVAFPGDIEILLIASSGDPDLSTVTDLRFYGDAGISVLALRADGATRLFAAVVIPEDAVPGWQDVFVEFGGSAELYRKTFQVMPTL